MPKKKKYKMKVGNFHYFILLLFSSPTYKIKLACTLSNQLCFQYFILLSSHQLVHSLFFSFFLFYFLIHTRQVTRTPQFPLFSDSVLNFLSSLSFYVAFLFLLLFSFVCVFFNSSTYQCFISFDFSPLLTQVSHLGFFVLLHFFCKVRLFTSFLSSSSFFFG